MRKSDPWSPHDDALLKHEWLHSPPEETCDDFDRIVADQLHRTPQAVRRRRQRLRLLAGRRWLPMDDQLLRTHWKANRKWTAMEFDVELATILNRTIGAVKARRQKLGLK